MILYDIISPVQFHDQKSSPFSFVHMLSNIFYFSKRNEYILEQILVIENIASASAPNDVGCLCDVDVANIA